METSGLEWKLLGWTLLKYGVLNSKLLSFIVNSFDYKVVWKLEDIFCSSQQNLLLGLKHIKSLCIYTTVFLYLNKSYINSCSAI